jgi:vacuolar-type H+-ATPase catalytic subunit A/Vma1
MIDDVIKQLIEETISPLKNEIIQLKQKISSLEKIIGDIEVITDDTVTSKKEKMIEELVFNKEKYTTISSIISFLKENNYIEEFRYIVSKNPKLKELIKESNHEEFRKNLLQSLN